MPGTKLTPMGVVILGLLHEDDMHPYEMLRLMRQRERDRILTITNGTMYNTVARLEARGLIAEVGTDRDGNRPERTTYSLAPEGERALHDWVRRELPRIDRATEFRLALAESHNLPLEEVADLLERRCEALRAASERDAAAIRTALERGVAEVHLVESQRNDAAQRADLAWLESLVARLRSGGLPWRAHTSQNSEQYLAQRKAARQ